MEDAQIKDSRNPRRCSPERARGRSVRVISLVVSIVGVVIVSGGAFAESEIGGRTLTERHEYFERKVRPLLTNRCLKCHGTVRQLGALRLDTAEGVFYGSTNGSVVVPGDPDASVLVQLARSTKERRMPPPRMDPKSPSQELKNLYDNPPLEAHEIGILERWVREGAVWPGYSKDDISGATGAKYEFTEEQKAFWSFQPIRDPVPPSVKDMAWPAEGALLDHFILAKLEAAGLEPSPAADPLKLLRRVTFDLTGLPPTPEEIQAFLADDSADAYRGLVDRLLDSPRYGERWGRHWLDVARYAETAAHDGNTGYLHAWRYRNWVIDAFNDDKPFDEFIVEQLAGDLLPEADNSAQRLKRHIATGFLQVGPKPVGMRDKRQLVLEIADEQIHATGVAFLGLTIACARCHNHKFDPIPARDYYSLAGIFMSTESFFDYERDSMHLEYTVEGPEGPVEVLAVRDKPRPHNLRVHTRGSYLTLAEEAPRGFLQIVAGEDHAQIDTAGSGRLELARWIASPDHPLTARVAVNRIWQKHFGSGLVRSTDDFGRRGDRPSHPELLDWLARRFIESGWSVKSLHRRILLSSTYRQSHSENPRSASIDPENSLLWRMPRRRLSAEEIRDTLLAIGDELDLSPGGSSLTAGYRPLQPPRKIVVVKVNDLYNFGPYMQNRRSVYLPVIRNQLHPVLALFDSSNEHEPTGVRTTTTTAPQSLFFLNGEFVRRHARNLAVRLLDMEDVTDEDRVRIAYEIVFGRPASTEETLTAQKYLDNDLEILDPGRRHRREGKSKEPVDLPPYADVVRATPGLIAYYDFEGDEEASRKESTGEGALVFTNRVTPGRGDARSIGDLGPSTSGVTGIVSASEEQGRSVRLDGKGQRLELSDTSRFDDDTGELSCEYWIYPESVRVATVIGRDGEGRRLWKSGLTPRDVVGRRENVLFYEFFSPSLGGYRESFQAKAPVGEWTHVVFTCGQGTRRLFVNGALLDEMSVAEEAIPSGGVPVSIGSRSNVGEYFHGRIDEVSIYNRVLSVAEVTARYGAATGKTVDQSSVFENTAWTNFCHALLCTNGFIYVD